MKEGNWFDGARRFWREATGEIVFHYDPNFTESVTKNGERSATTPWKKNPDGSITIGKKQIMMAIEQAEAFKGRGKDIAENAQTVIGLSLAYIRKHFPQALKDAGYRE